MSRHKNTCKLLRSPEIPRPSYDDTPPLTEAPCRRARLRPHPQLPAGWAPGGQAGGQAAGFPGVVAWGEGCCCPMGERDLEGWESGVLRPDEWT
eukprot:609244-Pelagomonas_calceolata.AAC.2